MLLFLLRCHYFDHMNGASLPYKVKLFISLVALVRLPHLWYCRR